MKLRQVFSTLRMRLHKTGCLYFANACRRQKTGVLHLADATAFKYFANAPSVPLNYLADCNSNRWSVLDECAHADAPDKNINVDDWYSPTCDP